tara:strand:+ start:3070 stop:3333 length:264 start_codon:yes stop_codon:yes gene_type:complete
MTKIIISPCISICKTDSITGYCYGCARTEEEKKIWKDVRTSAKWKTNNLREIASRMQGWQLSTFQESYEHKLKTGISIVKKNNLEKK